MARLKPNHLIGIAHTATDANGFYAATVVQPQKIPGILFCSTQGVFPARDQPCGQIFQRPLINEWPQTSADHIPAPAVSAEQGEA